jgi:hypothetical protein
MCRILIILFFLIFLPTVLSADVFLLKDGGKIEGELLNPGEVPRKTYQIKTNSGAVIAIEPKYIERKRKDEKEVLVEYKSFAPFLENTLENHLKTAEWCRTNQLRDYSDIHLKQVLELDPNHAEARRLLGYRKLDDGTWMTETETRNRKGYVLHKGSWRTQQQIDVETKFEEAKKISLQWEERVKKIVKFLPADQQARSTLLAINDSAATAALYKALSAEKNPDVQILLIQTLGNIGTFSPLQCVANWAMRPQENSEVRRTCYEVLKKHPEARQALVNFFTGFLTPQFDDVQIRLAAQAIGELGGKSAVPQLIDMLSIIRKRQRTIQGSGVPVGAANGGMGMASGTKTITYNDESNNREVLNALVRLTGTNFQYDETSWKNWLIQSRQSSSFNARRI